MTTVRNAEVDIFTELLAKSKEIDEQILKLQQAKSQVEAEINAIQRQKHPLVYSAYAEKYNNKQGRSFRHLYALCSSYESATTAISQLLATNKEYSQNSCTIQVADSSKFTRQELSTLDKYGFSDGYYSD